MFIPLFIAILLGLATPTNTNSNCTHDGGTTVTTNGDPATPPPGGDTGGEGGQIKPPK